MSNLLYAQYALIKRSRQVVFQFLKKTVTGVISKPLSVFNNIKGNAKNCSSLKYKIQLYFNDEQLSDKWLD